MGQQSSRGFVEQSSDELAETESEEGLAQSAWEVFHLETHWSWFAYLRMGITLRRISQYFWGVFFDRVIQQCTASFLDDVCICKNFFGRYFIWRRIIGQCHGLSACTLASPKNFFAFVYALFCWIGICGVTLPEYAWVRLLKRIFFIFMATLCLLICLQFASAGGLQSVMALWVHKRLRGCICVGGIHGHRDSLNY